MISLCAGQGRDLLHVLEAHPRRADVRARLVELDPHNVAVASAAIAEIGLERVEAVQGDAALTATYAGALPADLVLVCGVFGNISSEDVAYTIEKLPTLCASNATIIWTRTRRAPDLTPRIRQWFWQRGFQELAFDGKPESFGVGVHRLAAAQLPFDSQLKLFTFVR